MAARTLLALLPLALLLSCGESEEEPDDDKVGEEPGDGTADTDEDDEGDADTDTDGDADTDTDTPLDDVDDDGDGYSEADGDCDDGDPAVSPGATEICNDVDDDCDGDVDDDAVDATEWFGDSDGDGYGGGGGFVRCEAGTGMVARGGDCDDGDPSVNPDARDVTGDGDDDDCDGIDIDLDACMATLDSATLYAAAPHRLYRRHFPWISEMYTVSGVDVARWELDDAREYIFLQGIIATPTDDPLVWDLEIHATWELGQPDRKMVLDSRTQGDITALGFEEDEFDWTCEGTTARTLVVEGSMTFAPLGDVFMNYTLTGRTTAMTASTLAWSDFSWETTRTFDILGWDEGCTQDRADQLAQGLGFADFAAMIDDEFQAFSPRYLATGGISSGIENRVREACGEL
jgi:hypothetical protein